VAQDFTSSESSSEDSVVLLETPALEESKTVLVSLDSQLKDKEMLLRTFTQSQQELQNGLLEAMKQEYHLKVEQLSRELERLEADKQAEMKKVQGVLKSKVEGEFNSRQQQVQQQMQQAAKKDRDTKLMQRSLDDQQKRIQALQSDLDRLKTQKVLMMKKIKDETEKLQQARQERVKEVTRLKHSLQKAEKQNSELKREIVKKDAYAKRKQEELTGLQSRHKGAQSKNQEARALRQSLKQVDLEQIRAWIVSTVLRMVTYQELLFDRDAKDLALAQIDEELQQLLT
jgi:kinesin family protein 4/21/27